MLDKLVGTKVFSKIDLKSRYPYHHIRMGTTKWAYKWLLMSCQLSNAPDTFMWDMTFSWDHLQLFILMINWYIIKLKKSCVKCWRLFTTETLCKLEEVIFLVPQSCVSWLCCLDRWITSRSWEGASYQRLVCATIHGQCLYWLASFYMRFHVCVCVCVINIKNSAQSLSSITECLERVDFQWSKSAQRAFEHIKTLMTEAPVTALLYFGKFFLWSGIGHIGELVYRCFWWV